MADDGKTFTLECCETEESAWDWASIAKIVKVAKNHPGKRTLFAKFPTGLLVMFPEVLVSGSEEFVAEFHSGEPLYWGLYNPGTTRHDELRGMPYREYLQTPEWKETAKRKRRQAGNRCQVCNASGVQLDVHHRTYENRGHELDEDLIVLCHECHGIFEKAGKLKECQDANV